MAIRPDHISSGTAAGKGGIRDFSGDLCLIDWLEAKGFQYDVITDEDLHSEGVALLSSYNVILTGAHPEYWTEKMLDALELYLKRGGRLMYLGGNGFYWVTSVDPDRPHIIEVRRWGGTQSWRSPPGEYYHSSTGELGGIWRNRGRPPQKLAGIGFSAQGFDTNSVYKRLPDSLNPRASFIFDGVGKEELIGDFGNLGQKYGAAGDELDRADQSLGTPSHALIVATAKDTFTDYYQAVVEEIDIADSKQGGTVSPLVRADMVYFEGPNEGAVFSVGSIAWIGSLYYNNYENNVSRITENVLRRFSSDRKAVS
jgi:N,N-dimethylformamidase